MEPVPVPLKRPDGLVGMPAVLDHLIRTHPVPDDQILLPGRLLLSSILPQSEWWRIYLARMDHVTALRKFPDNPGYCYDSENSPGFQKSMFEAYHQVLDGVQFQKCFDDASLTWNDYQAFYNLVTAHSNIPPRVDGPIIVFPVTPCCIATDIDTEILLNRPLLTSMTDPRSASALCWLTRDDPNGTGNCMVNTNIKDNPALVNAAFRRFQLEIRQADRRAAQLRAIAKLIRFLHVLHPFRDGNGRLHVSFLLPRLLLQYRFGPPLRLGPYCATQTLDGLFNGCFTLDQIVWFLWHAQQLPGTKIEDLNLENIK